MHHPRNETPERIWRWDYDKYYHTIPGRSEGERGDEDECMTNVHNLNPWYVNADGSQIWKLCFKHAPMDAYLKHCDSTCIILYLWFLPRECQSQDPQQCRCDSHPGQSIVQALLQRRSSWQWLCRGCKFWRYFPSGGRLPACPHEQRHPWCPHQISAEWIRHK